VSGVATLSPVYKFVGWRRGCWCWVALVEFLECLGSGPLQPVLLWGGNVAYWGSPASRYWLLFWSEDNSVDDPQPPNGCVVWYPHSHVLSLVVVHSVRIDRGVPV
jgi:hypothetical protein